MKNHILLLIAGLGTIGILAAPGIVLSHMGSEEKPSTSTIPNQNIQELKKFEDQIMGPQNHQEIETIMRKIMEGRPLSNEEKEKFFSAMQDNQMSPGMMSMMLRHLASNQESVSRNRSMLSSNWEKGYDIPIPLLIYPLLIIGLITNVSFLILSILGIFALIKWLKKN